MVDQFKFNHKKVNDSIIYKNKNEGKGKLILKIVSISQNSTLIFAN
jgi:hypothetical protein